MIVGLTGSIATGKSTVTQMLRDLGARVLDADVWARKVVEPKSEGLKEIVSAFGKKVLTADGSLDRGALGQIIFHDLSARERLNAITHPRIRNGMGKETQEFLRKHPGEPVVWDVPLLFEGETRQLVNITVLVYVDEKQQLERLMKRDGLTPAEARARIVSQMSVEQKRSLADYVIDNTKSLSDTKEQVQRLWRRLKTRAREEYESSSSTSG